MWTLAVSTVGLDNVRRIELLDYHEGFIFCIMSKDEAIAKAARYSLESLYGNVYFPVPLPYVGN